MCVIIDASVASDFLSDDARPVMEAIISRGLRVVAGEKVKEELLGCPFRAIYRELLLGGRLIEFDDHLIKTARDALPRKQLKSNDAHIIALAQVSGARILFSRDINLHADFKNAKLIDKPRGCIYQNRKHRKLLVREDACACG